MQAEETNQVRGVQVPWESVRATFIERLGAADGPGIADGVIAAFKGDAGVRGTALSAVVAGVPERLVADVGALIRDVRAMVEHLGMSGENGAADAPHARGF
jgi:hypothetical protein